MRASKPPTATALWMSVEVSKLLYSSFRSTTVYHSAAQLIITQHNALSFRSAAVYNFAAQLIIPQHNLSFRSTTLCHSAAQRRNLLLELPLNLAL
jgi:hypothetical protein